MSATYLMDMVRGRIFLLPFFSLSTPYAAAGCIAAGAGIIGMSATYPMDMVRGRITIQDATNQQYRGLMHATGCIIRCAGGTTEAVSWRDGVVQGGGRV